MRGLLFLGWLALVLPQAQAQRFNRWLATTPGVVSYTYRQELTRDVPAALDLIKQSGLANLELSNLFGKTAPEFRALLDARGMRCTSYGVGYQDLATKLPDVIAAAKALGASYVRVAWIPHEGKFTLAKAQEAVALFNQAGQTLHQNGLRFCYHNHGYEFEPHEKGTLFDYLVQNTHPAHVGFEMDVMWTQLPGQDPAALLRKYPARFWLMHLKDFKKELPRTLTGQAPPESVVPVGTGAINVRAILKAARKTKIEHIYLEDEHPEAAKQVPISLAYLRDL
jgi:sugar phosphate isomerase/epimerase